METIEHLLTFTAGFAVGGVTLLTMYIKDKETK